MACKVEADSSIDDPTCLADLSIDDRKLTFGRNTAGVPYMGKKSSAQTETEEEILPPLPYLTRIPCGVVEEDIKPTSHHDPLSHRIIEKRRRDRMNNCLADLSRLIPNYYLKKGRGRIEKTEIIEMAIKYMKHLQAHACDEIGNCEITTKQDRKSKEMDHFQAGYQESMSETLQFLRDSEGLFSGDSLCVRIMNHLKKHCEKIMTNQDDLKLNGSRASSSFSSGYQANGSSTGSCSDGNGSGTSNHGSDLKDSLLSEESAYRSEFRVTSDERENASFSSPSEFNEEGTPNSPQNSRPNSPTADDSKSPIASGDQVHSPNNQFPHEDFHHSRNDFVSTSMGPEYNHSSSGEDISSSRLYKFKSNMKHRFSADSEHSTTQTKKKRRDSDFHSEGCHSDNKDCRTPYMHPSSVQSPSYNATTDDVSSHLHPKEESEGPSVPIFALNSAGSFYVPLTVDYSIVAPAMNSIDHAAPSLHPVSIHVNFRSRTQSATSPKSVPVVSTMPPDCNYGHLTEKFKQEPLSVKSHKAPLPRTFAGYDQSLGMARERLEKRRMSHHDFVDQYLPKPQNTLDLSSRKSGVSSSPAGGPMEHSSPELHRVISQDMSQEATLMARNGFRNYSPRDPFREMAARSLGANPLLRDYSHHPSAFLPRDPKYLPPHPWNYPLGPSPYKD